MSILTKDKILKKIEEGTLIFTPKLDELQLQPHSVDLRLGYTFMVPRTWTTTPNGREAVRINTSTTDNLKTTHAVELEEGQFFEILPNERVIATTLDKIKMPPDTMATLFPRSSLNRRGLSINLTGVIDAGFEGNLIIPIENKNRQPVRLYPGERFCQLTFHELEGSIKLKTSRWHNTDVIVGILPEDNGDETNLIIDGKVKEIKEKFAI